MWENKELKFIIKIIIKINNILPFNKRILSKGIDLLSSFINLLNKKKLLLLNNNKLKINNVVINMFQINKE